MTTIQGMMMSDGQKICVICGESCAGQARIKNSKGQYAHQACAEAQQRAKQEAAQVEEMGGLGSEGSLDDALGGGMDDLLGDLEIMEEGGGGSAAACPSCGQRLADGALVCMSCGYNTQTGKGMKTVAREARVKGDSKAAAIGAAAGGMALKPILPVLGAVIGGLIGALVWAFISYQFNVEISWIAVGVGFLTGLGAAIGAQGEGGAVTGGMAALVAIGAISVGKYAAVTWAVQDAFGSSLFQPITLEEVTDDMVLTSVADEVCEEKILAGESIGWEDPELFVLAAEWPDDYPDEIRGETWDQWEAMSFGEKASFRRDLADEWGMGSSDIDDDWALQELADGLCRDRILNDNPVDWNDDRMPMRVSSWPEDYPAGIKEATNTRWAAMSADDQHTYRLGVLEDQNAQRDMSGELGQAIVKEGFIQSFMHPFDLLFMVLAVGAAYGVASNEG